MPKTSACPGVDLDIVLEAGQAVGEAAEAERRDGLQSAFLYSAPKPAARQLKPESPPPCQLKGLSSAVACAPRDRCKTSLDPLHARVAVLLRRSRAFDQLRGLVAVGQREALLVLGELEMFCGLPASTSATLTPASARRSAAQPPDAPEPTTSTSKLS